MIFWDGILICSNTISKMRSIDTGETIESPLVVAKPVHGHVFRLQIFQRLERKLILEKDKKNQIRPDSVRMINEITLQFGNSRGTQVFIIIKCFYFMMQFQERFSESIFAYVVPSTLLYSVVILQID